ncbi:peptidase C39 family protein [Rubrobacter marinus]|uniref:Peptidase C39 family protein n=1 Tax=Rubrobacter marinus TaxID=2653852 RepID=A0A6G8PTK9_9ACTN|nr:peptidase C39 family protein [Rubrobacter marinus]QIN77848.1 peptidase C39 family protein [Rubrobacter marinus]
MHEGPFGLPSPGATTRVSIAHPRVSTFRSPVYETPFPFDTLVPSWSATTPAGTWIHLRFAVRSDGRWSPALDLGVWASGTEAVRRSSARSEEAAAPAAWRVEVDTVRGTAPGTHADAYRFDLDLVSSTPGLLPTVREVSVLVSDSSRHGEDPGDPEPAPEARGRDLPVPARSQMLFPHGGEAWCSPTSLSMVMAYWAQETGERALDRPVPEVADGVYDRAYRGWGNWPFNTAYAAALGLEARVGRLRSLAEAGGWVAAGVPLVVSVAWDNGVVGQELSGAPLARSDGHLLVIRGFAPSGDVIVNDPAAPRDAGVARVYERGELSRAWLRNRGSSGGIAYLVHPPGWSVPRASGFRAAPQGMRRFDTV